MSSKNTIIDGSLLAKAWTPTLMELELESSSSLNNNINNDNHSSVVCKAVERTLPLLDDDAASSVPFVCRYRTDVINPLTTKQVHHLQTLMTKHKSLASLRTKLMKVAISDKNILERIQTSTSKTELEDFYAPFKPPSKGSILERIQKEYPELVESVDQLWSNEKGTTINLSKLSPREPLVQLLSSKIASEPKITLAVLEELRKHCRIKSSVTKSSDDDLKKYSNYDNFSNYLMYLKDHQVLALRRGIKQKVIKLSYDIDGSKMESSIKYHLRQENIIPVQLIKRQDLLKEAIHDAWKRLLRRRGTTRLWNEKCKEAEERACQVFEDNLRRALLAPPFYPPKPILSLDPGFKAGIKCAILNSNGAVIKLDTVKFLGRQRDESIKVLSLLLSATKKENNKLDGGGETVLVALGNGHGSQESRTLIEEVSHKTDIPIDLQVVNEAGASVWSVTEGAKEEFPEEAPAAIAAISLGRRLQNPLHELVKVPPRSLGLGMYQHDLSESELDERLHLTSVDAVATIGVDVNSCSLEILRKVPGLKKLSEKVVQCRPFRQRKDLLTVAGLGPKTYENCAAFCRLSLGSNPLDSTLVHPESYDLATWLLKKFSWKLSEPPSSKLLLQQKKEMKENWTKQASKASKKFGVNQERVFAVLDNLIDSMTNVDPRIKDDDASGVDSGSRSNKAGSVQSCKILPPEFSSLDKLINATTPMRNIIGTVRNIADFGAFIDFGGQNDGLIHTSKLGPIRLTSLLIGQQLGVDILNVEKNGKISLAVAGLNMEATNLSRSHHNSSNNNNISSRSGRKRSISTQSGSKKSKKRKISNK